jgi:hypothetical protein
MANNAALSAIPSAGTVLHIRDFLGIGHAPKNKFAYVIGGTNEGGLLFFLISTQDYSKTELARETIFIPPGTCPSLRNPKGCWIQCFHRVEYWSASELLAALENGRVTWEGELPREFLIQVRTVVEKSNVLMEREITECLSVIGNL